MPVRIRVVHIAMHWLCQETEQGNQSTLRLQVIHETHDGCKAPAMQDNNDGLQAAGVPCLQVAL